MPSPTPLPIRRAIWRRWCDGQDAPRIAEELGLAPRTVRHLLRRFRDRGEAGIAPDYRPPARADDPEHLAAHDAAIALRREHPGWGAPLIRSLLLRDRPAAAVSSARSLQRAFRRAGLGPPPRSEQPPPRRCRAAGPHEVWQMDACEAIPTAGGGASWLRVVDEFTGAPLATRVFSRGPLGRRPGRRDRRDAPRRVRAVGQAGAAPGR